MCSIIGQSQKQWVTFTNSRPTKPIVQVLTSSNTSIRYEVEIPGMYLDTILINGQTYQRLSLPGGQKWGNPGYPEIPAIGKMVAIPENSTYTISYSLTDSLVLNGYSICPAPYIVEDTSGGDAYLKEEFIKNDSIYSTNQFFPVNTFDTRDGGYLRNQKILNMSAFPFKYNPVTGQLVVYTRFEVAVQIGNPQNADINVNNGLFSRLSQSTLLNFENTDQIQPPAPLPSPKPGTVTWMTLTDPSQANNIVADYLFITDDQFFNPQHSISLQRLANHRASFNGFDVVIVSVQNILGLNFAYDPPINSKWISERKIRTFIKQVYDGQHAAHTYDGRLAFICLVGDASIDGTDSGVPTSWDPDPTCTPGSPTLFWAANDYYYSCVTKDSNNKWDLLGDIFIGRLSVDNESDLSHVVSKTMHNENEYCFEDWKKINTLAYGGSFTGADPIKSHKYFCEDLPDWLNSIYNPAYSTTLIDATTGQGLWNENYVNFLNNTGANIVFHLGHGQTDAWCQGGNCYQTSLGALTINYKKDNLANNGKYPFVISQSCFTGAFSGANNSDCMAESIIQYSATAGYVGYLGSWKAAGMDYTAPGEFPNSLQEKIMGAIYIDLSTILGEAVLEARIGVCDPNFVSSYNPFQFQHNLFGDPAYNLMAPGYEITQNKTLPSPLPSPQITEISSPIYVRSGVTLTLSTNAALEFSGKGQLIIDEGATLEIGDNVTIKGQNSTNRILINGTLCGLGGNSTNPIAINGLTLESLDGTTWAGLEFSNPNLTLKMNGCSISNCGISGELAGFETRASGTFTNSSLHFSPSGLIVDGCSFNTTDILVTNYEELMVSAQILNSSFQNSPTDAVLTLEYYPNFTIQNCTITYDHGKGIYLSYCGNGSSQYTIENNAIQKTGSSQDQSWGIMVYQSFADIENNVITNNRYGVSTLNQSQVRLIGNPNATSNSGTQRIFYNYQNQVRSADNSFPFYFHYNILKNTPSGSTYLVYYDPAVPEPEPIDNTFDVRCNCFDNSTPTPQLYPSGWYQWTIWCPPSLCQIGSSAADEFAAASLSMETGDYTVAETQFKSVISNNPGSSYAKESAKKLISLKKLSDKDFTGLKMYFDTTTALHADSVTDHLVYRLKNKCDLEQENFTQAITWFENDIMNPASLNDSVYSLVDLSNTYMVMQGDSNLKSSLNNYTGSLSQYKPKNAEEYVLRKADWIKLLFNDKEINENENAPDPLNNGYILQQNTPNPFSTTTQLSYSLPQKSDVAYVVTNMLGRQVVKEYLSTQEPGQYTITIDLTGNPDGIYVIVLVANGKEVSKIKAVKIH